jgi:hypothetical protein
VGPYFAAYWINMDIGHHFSNCGNAAVGLFICEHTKLCKDCTGGHISMSSVKMHTSIPLKYDGHDHHWIDRPPHCSFDKPVKQRLHSLETRTELFRRLQAEGAINNQQKS